MEQVVANAISRPRLYAVLLGSFAGLAGALAVIGIYGVIAYVIAQRRREIGIRLALGATAAHVVSLVVGRTLTAIASGLVIGLAAAVAVRRFLEGMLYGLTPLDPATFTAVAVTFGLIATVASYVPARRALRTDPVAALRSE